ncbi:hypothetical protein BROUX41_001545 [Berkeleyomyces rouxiae]|uniref:uncharacterized protein n=1 Tax=Berkeleyomyces rouxiae TaxID=2035830 RepID=UPI003B797FBB
MHRPQAGRMNHRHLPAGQAVPGVAAAAGTDIAQPSSGPGAGAGVGAGAPGAPIVVSSSSSSPNIANVNHGNGHGANPGGRRRGPNHGGYYHQNQHMHQHQHQHQHHQNQHQHHQHQHQHQQPMANPYGPYAMYNQPNQYYQHIPQYPNPMMHHGGYMSYHPHQHQHQHQHQHPHQHPHQHTHQHLHQQYARPQPIQSYVAPMASVAASSAYPRPTPSPALATPYQPPPMPQGLQQPQTPSSVHAASHHGLTPPLSSTRDFTPGVPFITDSAAAHVAPIVSSDAPVVVSSQSYSSYPSAPPSVSSAVASVVASVSTYPSSNTVAPPAPVSDLSSVSTAAAAPVTVSSSPLTASAEVPSASQTLTPSAEPFHPKFHIPVPWISCPESEWPTKAPRSRRRRRAPLQDGAELLRQHVVETSEAVVMSKGGEKQDSTMAEPITLSSPIKVKPAVASAPIASPEFVPAAATSQTKSTTTGSTKPVVPVVPVIPKVSAKDAAKDEKLETSVKSVTADKPEPQNGASPDGINGQTKSISHVDAKQTTVTTKVEAAAPAAAPSAVKPVNWASLLKSSAKAPTNTTESAAVTTASRITSTPGAPISNGASTKFAKEKTNSLADALRSFTVDGSSRIAFLEPRGLVNGGNMCYMNSILQVLLHCIPFYDFLDQVSKKATHSFNKSETPLIDAMIMFIQEFRVTASAPTAEKLYEIIRSKERQFGEPFSPTFLYDEMNKSKRFANMEQGHQQDAEEFLGLLLQVLDDECTKVLATSNELPEGINGDVSGDANATPVNPGDDWMEVGPRQKATVSRVTGQNSTSPISRIFGGYVRSELLKPGLKPSLTTQFFQSLQLDINVPHIMNILDALKHMARKEVFIVDSEPSSAKTEKLRATTQTLISELPPILILHLKRFEFDAEGGTVKLWNNIGYPLELEIPKEILARQTLARLSSEGKPLPKYRLSAVVYHHGKNASVGHYTVDVRRQDAREWIHIDDTKIEQIRTEEVAYAGSEGEGTQASANPNRFGLIDDNGGMGDDQGWKQVTSPANGNKRYSSAANAVTVAPATTPAPSNGNSNGNGKTIAFKGKQSQQMLNDSKVAYILFYQRV